MSRKLSILVLSMTLFACSQTRQPIQTMEYVDLQRFMGDWYVIASIPTFIEKGAHNAVESYVMNEDGTVATTFTFHADKFDGEKKVYNPKGFIRDKSSNAIWGMQFIWPIKADYRIVHVNQDYNRTIIGRNARDYVWIMARTPAIPEQEYQSLVRLIGEQGYDTSKIIRVPQEWNGRNIP
jgi:apolipoprotein D and lipocalin family protein